MPQPDSEQIAHNLGGEVAFLRADQGVYFARRAPGSPLSPVVRLLQGIWALEPKRAPWITRHRVYTTEPASPAAAGAVKVAARYMRASIRAHDHGLRVDAPLVDAAAAVPTARQATDALYPRLAAIVGAAPAALRADGEWMTLALELARVIAVSGQGLERPDNPVAALLVAPSGELLSWAAHSGSLHAMGHAELNLVESWLAETRTPLPAGARIIASLKPCKMCAGALWEAAADPWSLHVVFAEDDTSRYARETVLDAGSMARRAVAPDEERLGRRLQEQLRA